MTTGKTKKKIETPSDGEICKRQQGNSGHRDIRVQTEKNGKGHVTFKGTKGSLLCPQVLSPKTVMSLSSKNNKFRVSCPTADLNTGHSK
jgi:hypothetical protein